MRSFPSIEDLRQRARRNVPKMFFEYAEAGSYNEETLRSNRADMERLKLRQRVLVNVDQLHDPLHPTACISRAAENE